MARYDATIDLTLRNNSHTMAIEYVGSGKRVLDVGCATGYLAEFLANERDCDVYALEPDVEAAAQAEQYLPGRVKVAGVEALGDYQAGMFDVVIYADVLEHLVDPAQVLRDTRRLLAPGGAVVASVPNAAHGDLRLHLLAGLWQYRQTGLLDSTHLRFFTKNTLQRMFTQTGYRISELGATRVPLGASEIAPPLNLYPEQVLHMLRLDPEHADYQYLIKAQIDDDTAVLFEAAPDWMHAPREVLLAWAQAFSPAEPVRLLLPVDGDAQAAEQALAVAAQCLVELDIDPDLIADIDVVPSAGLVDGPRDSHPMIANPVALRALALPRDTDLLG